MEQKLIIKGGKALSGEVDVYGYKNAAGACIAAALLSSDPTVIDNLPLISDILDEIRMLEEMGVKVEWLDERRVRLTPVNINPEKISIPLFEKMRLSIFLVGPLLARFRKIRIPHPGGDKIGLRPISTHIQALKDFGVKVEEKDGFYYFEAPADLTGKTIVLKEFSVSATAILMMLAALTNGKTKIELAAAEPQIQDLGIMLRKMGADVSGVGGHTIVIDGRNKLHGTEFRISPDLLEVGTFMIALAITNGQGRIRNVNSKHLTMFLEKMREIGVSFEIFPNEIWVRPSLKFQATKIQTMPYPGFPTDLQPQISVLLTQADGKSIIHETLFENRFQYLQELRKMGADIEITDPHRALIFGKTKLNGSKLNALDIRSGAALILAGLAAEGTSEVDNIAQIERGYEKIEEKLLKLGAQIERV